MPNSPDTFSALPTITSPEHHHQPDSSYSSSPRIAVANLDFWIDDEAPADADYAIPTSTFEGIAPTQAVIPTGLPVVDAGKKPAYPSQDALLSAVQHHVTTAAPDYFGYFETRMLIYYQQANDLYFGGKLPAIHIKIGPCRSPRSILGTFRAIGDHGLSGEITLNQRLFTGQHKGVLDTPETHEGFVHILKDITLHEMVHAYCHLVLSQPELTYYGHGPVFSRECNRIGTILGLPRVRTSWNRSHDDSDMFLCNHWPHAVRDNDFYQGAWRDEDPDPHKNTKKHKKSGGGLSTSELLDLLTDSSDHGDLIDSLFKLAASVGSNRTGWRRIAYAVALIGRQRKSPAFMPKFPSATMMAKVVGGSVKA